MKGRDVGRRMGMEMEKGGRRRRRRREVFVGEQEGNFRTKARFDGAKGLQPRAEAEQNGESEVASGLVETAVSTRGSTRAQRPICLTVRPSPQTDQT